MTTTLRIDDGLKSDCDRVFEIDEHAKAVRILRYFHSSENYANKL